jgi:hypothetical protein
MAGFEATRMAGFDPTPEVGFEDFKPILDTHPIDLSPTPPRGVTTAVGNFFIARDYEPLRTE